MKLRILTVVVSCIGAVAGVGGYVAAINHNTIPMVRQVNQAGYPTQSLSNPSCTDFDGAYDCDDRAISATNKDIVEVTYRPAGSPRDCLYRLQRINPGLTQPSTWKFQFYIDEVDGITPSLGTTSENRGGKGDGWTQDDEGRRAISIVAPTPTQLWAFVLEHLDRPDPRCKPIGA